MLSILLIYWIGKSFYGIAESTGRGPWTWAIAGVVFFYGIQLLIGIAIILIWFFDDIDALDSATEKGIGYLAAIISGVFTYFLFKYLRKRWTSSKIGFDNNMLDDDVIQQNF